MPRVCLSGDPKSWQVDSVNQPMYIQRKLKQEDEWYRAQEPGALGKHLKNNLQKIIEELLRGWGFIER